MHFAAGALAVVLALTLSSAGRSAEPAETPCAKVATCRSLFGVGDGLSLPIYANRPLSSPQPAVHRALIIVHGTNRDGGNYFRTGLNAAAKARVLDETIVIAPTFTVKKDLSRRAEGEIYWDRNDGWKQGDPSAKARSRTISSFAAVDEIIRRLGDRVLFPDLQIVVVAGHSAGGQFVQRYAAGQPAGLVPVSVDLRYVVANPSTYLYFGKERPSKDGGFAAPEDSSCAYDRYKYGLERRNAYMSAVDPAALADRYRERAVVYLLGERDTDPNGDDLDKTCAAMTQGPHRLARGLAFTAYMDEYLAPHRHHLATIGGAGHSRTAMFTAPAGLEALFR